MHEAKQGCAKAAESYDGLIGKIDGLYSMLTILHIPERVSQRWPISADAYMRFCVLASSFLFFSGLDT